MFNSGRLRYVLFPLLGVLLLFAGCGSLEPKAGLNSSKHSNTGSLRIATDVSGIPLNDLSSLALLLAKESQTLTQQVPIVANQASATVDNLLTGTWEATLMLKDAVGDVLYDASGSIDILPSATSSLSLVLRPRPGILEVSADPQAHPLLVAAQKARLNVNPGGYSSMEFNDGDVLWAEKELAPGTYDYSISFYNGGYYASDLIYESPWTTVTVEPGKRLAIVWNPNTGTGSISGSVDVPPAAPSNIRLSQTSEGLAITWDAVAEEDLAGYRVYLRDNVFDMFDLVAETTAEQTTYVHPESKLDSGTHVEVVVTAVDTAEQESERSTVVAIDV